MSVGRPATIELTARVVSSYLSSHQVAANDVPGLIRSILGALQGDEAISEEHPGPSGLTRAQIRKSIMPDALISFEDGRRYKTLKRHLNFIGLTPAAYRAKWGLPSDYPMVAPSYSEYRSSLAKRLGLGLKATAFSEKAETRLAAEAT